MALQNDGNLAVGQVRLYRVAVKFLDDFNRDDQFQLPYVDGAERCFPDDLNKFWDPLKNQYPGIILKRVYTTVSPKRIRQMVVEAQQRDKEYQAPNFLTFFAIDTPSLDAAKAIATYLSGWQGVVEYAYVQPLAGLPSLNLSQTYVAEPTTDWVLPSKGGVNAVNVLGWSEPGTSPWASGDGIRFVDIEKCWDLNHPSLMTTGVQKISFATGLTNNYNLELDPFREGPSLLYASAQHGTRVLGILAANENTDTLLPNWKGIAERAGGYVISIFWEPDRIQNIEDAIMKASDFLDAGDVILLELWIPVQGFGDAVQWPVECSANVFPPIRLATALGITVVEAAGNSNRDFDDPTSSPFKVNPVPSTYVPNPNYNKDSGAIIVGAVSTVTIVGTSVKKGNKYLSSNYGLRVNCFAWGDSVHTLEIDSTTGYDTIAGDPLGDPLTTPTFAETSAASAIIAGAAIVLQAFAKYTHGVPFSALQVRNILSDLTTGTLTYNSIQTLATTTPNRNVDKIGVMPDLAAIITSMLNLANLVIRDSLSDDGSPHADAVSSPDIIIRSVTDPPGDFGDPTTDGLSLSSTIHQNGDYDIFVRVLNQGGGNGSNAVATVYYSPVTTYLSPSTWIKIGSSIPTTSVPQNTPASTSMTVLSKVQWSPAPASGDYCLIATVGCTEDPDPIPDHNALPATLTGTQFLDLMRANNTSSRIFNVQL